MVDILGWFWTSAVLVIGAFIVIMLISTYNRLVGLRQNVRQGVAACVRRSTVRFRSVVLVPTCGGIVLALRV